MKKISIILALAITTVTTAQVKLTSAMLGSYNARQIGSAEMSGRITAIDVVSANTRVYYVGTAGGGVWKTTNAGTTFKPIFDKYCQSIGALAIDQKNPDVIWVGTGESNMRNSVAIGTGIFMSTDAGSNWRSMGLDSSEHISKVVIDPNNSDIIYVSVPGPLWSNSKHRGLYKTIDAGKTWTKILYTDVKTGCADVIIDPKNSNVLYASMWEFRRTPWSFSSGGKGSALYKSMDAGKTWKKIQNGFDGQEMGRICLAISPSETNKLYAIAESKNTALYATSDGGESWTKKSAGMNVTWRPFYFSVIVVDPVDPKRIYRPSLNLSISSDGGESFKEASFEGGWVHSDHHALWINPNNNSHLILGTDGGVYQSLDRGNSWTMFKNLPVSQFYHVSVDDQVPYNVYGGLQDNGSWFAPSQSVSGIENKDWTNCGGGDGFWVQPDRSNPDIVYSESQGGYINRYNKKTNESRDIRPFPLAGEPKLRCNWNSPIMTSPTNKQTLYFGAQYLYRSYDKGDTWEKISPDLTTNNKAKQEQEKSGGLSVDNSGAENHCTIFAIAESPKDENMIWVGTDDGNVQLTTNGGANWTKKMGFRGLPANAWVSSIDPSPHDRNTVFITFDNHAMGDMKPHVYMSKDAGTTWTSISTKEIKGYAHKIKQDLVNPSLLFVGTELGLFVSWDLGKRWIQYTANVPCCAVRDIVIHAKTNDLILGTHGRGIIIIDDLTPLRAIDQKILDSEMSFLPTRSHYITAGKYGGSWPNGGYNGPNSTEEFVVMYYLKDRVMKGDVRLEFYDANGKKVGSAPGSKRRGLNVVAWDMRMKPPRVAKGVKLDFSGFTGPMITEGIYTIKLVKGDQSIEQKMEIKNDPTSYYSLDDRKLQQTTLWDIFKLQEDLAYLGARLNAIKDQAASRKNGNAANKTLGSMVDALLKKVDVMSQTIVASIEGTNITGEEKLREKISDLYYGVLSYEGKPTQSQLDRFKGLQKEYQDAVTAGEKIFNTDLKALNAYLVKAKLDEVKLPSREDWDKETLK